MIFKLRCASTGGTIFAIHTCFSKTSFLFSATSHLLTKQACPGNACHTRIHVHDHLSLTSQLPIFYNLLRSYRDLSALLSISYRCKRRRHSVSCVSHCDLYSFVSNNFQGLRIFVLFQFGFARQSQYTACPCLCDFMSNLAY